MSLMAQAPALIDAAFTLAGSNATSLGFIPNPEPVDPTNGSEAGSMLFSLLKGGIILAAGLGALISIYYLIFGRYADNPGTLSKGKVGIPIAVLCLVLAFVTIPALNAIAGSL